MPPLFHPGLVILVSTGVFVDKNIFKIDIGGGPALPMWHFTPSQQRNSAFGVVAGVSIR